MKPPMSSARPWVAGVALLAAADVSMSHHSFAMFDSGRCSTVSGTVRSVEWTYPHAWLWVAVSDAQGGVVLWGFEGGAPRELNARGGWTKTSARPGDKIQVRFNPLRNGQKGGAFQQVTLADGRVLKAVGPPNACELSGGAKIK